MVCGGESALLLIPSYGLTRQNEINNEKQVGFVFSGFIVLEYKSKAKTKSRTKNTWAHWSDSSFNFTLH